MPVLREAIARHQQRFYGLAVDPDHEVLVTAGATEAIAAALLGLLDDGDEVVVLEPMFDSYAAGIALAGARAVPVLLRPEADGRYRFDPAELRAAVGPRTRLILLNTPHNPTGKVLTAEELGWVADVALEHDLLVVTDEVYEHLVFPGAVHVPLATLPGMAERTLTISSGGKTFSTTGWKVGWITGPAGRAPAPFARRPHLVYFLHDELVVHAPADLAPAVADEVRAAAAAAGRLLFGDFPVEFPLTVGVAERYGDAKG